jgi:hypothetical protein
MHGLVFKNTNCINKQKNLIQKLKMPSYCLKYLNQESDKMNLIITVPKWSNIWFFNEIVLESLVYYHIKHSPFLEPINFK